MERHLCKNTGQSLTDIIDVAHALRQGQLHIEQEQTTFAQCFHNIDRSSLIIYKLAYLCSRQRQYLKESGILCVAESKTNVQNDYDKIVTLFNHKVRFFESKTALDYEHVLVFEKLFQLLHRSPKLLAQLLIKGVQISAADPLNVGDEINCIVNVLFHTVYASAIHQKDIDLIVELLHNLLQLNTNPSKCPTTIPIAEQRISPLFEQIYRQWIDTSIAAKVFLIAALYQPIMELIDATAAMHHKEVPGDEESHKISAQSSVNGAASSSLASGKSVMELLMDEDFSLMCFEFATGLQNYWCLFPPALRKLLQLINDSLTKDDEHISSTDKLKINVYLIFEQFICPAIENPELMGIGLSVPITETVRNQLHDVSRVVHALALNGHNGINLKFRKNPPDLHYEHLLQRLIDDLLKRKVSLLDNDVSTMSNDFQRHHLLISKQELMMLMDYLRTIIKYGCKVDVVVEQEYDQLRKLLQQLPKYIFLNGYVKEKNCQRTIVETSSLNKEKSRQFGLNINKATIFKLSSNRSTTISDNHDDHSNPHQLHFKKISNDYAAEEQYVHDDDYSPDYEMFQHVTEESDHYTLFPIHAIQPIIGEYGDNEIVLIFTLQNDMEEKIQPLTEAEYELQLNRNGPMKSKQNHETNEDIVHSYHHRTDNCNAGVNNFNVMDDNMSAILTPSHPHNVENFVLGTTDDISCGNSDILEAASEVQSNHSVTSSIELEENDQNDNLSDMISANISDPDSPNISGHDTPSSQVTDGESINHLHLPTPQMQKLISKVRSDIQDKFCKFEIRKMEGDENVSVMSDTWSTDVLASDSEMMDVLEQSREQHNFSTCGLPPTNNSVAHQNYDILIGGKNNNSNRTSYWDVSDQRSESNWSTDVLTSDSEKVNEVDTDDNVSISTRFDNNSVGRMINERDKLTVQHPLKKSFHQCQELKEKNKSNCPIIENNNRVSAEASGCDKDKYLALSSLERSSMPTTYADDSNWKLENATDSIKLLKTKQQISTGGVGGGDQYCKNLIDFNANSDLLQLSRPALENHCNGNNYHHGLQDIIAGSSSLSTTSNGQSVMEHVNNLPKPDDSTDDVKAMPFPKTIDSCNEDILCAETLKLRLQEEDNETSKSHSNVQRHGKEMNIIEVDTKLDTKLPITSSTHKSRKSTGAIPKSISFSASVSSSSSSSSGGNVENAVESNDPSSSQSLNEANNIPGILNKLKQGIFRNRRGTHKHPENVNTNGQTDSNLSPLNKPQTTDVPLNRREECNVSTACNECSDISDDILEKYRGKVENHSSEEAVFLEKAGPSPPGDISRSNCSEKQLSSVMEKNEEFDVVKSKLLRTLSKTELHLKDFRIYMLNSYGDGKTSPLMIYLQMQLGQAINVHNYQQITYLSEVIRCISQMDYHQHLMLLDGLQTDVQNRLHYIQYLLRFRRNLFSIMENIQQYRIRFNKKSDKYSHHLLSTTIQLFLKKRTGKVENFISNFGNLTAYDDKVDLVEEFIVELIGELQVPVIGILHNKPEYYVLEARNILELLLLQQVYEEVLFPNDDADLSRDEVFERHIKRLQHIITPRHPALCISKMYISEAPWQIAQKELAYIKTCFTPREKLRCIYRCITSIANLLRISTNHSPCADEILPVLIYVIIMANPPYLLSTIEYINGFMARKLTGEDQFNWTMFSSAVKFIKTLDYVYQ